MPTLYEVLDVERDADRARIQAAFRDRVKAVHPDHSDDPDAREKFQRVYTAQEVLCDPAERQRYDTIGHASYVRQHGDPDLWNLSSGTDRTVEGTATRSTGSATRSGADREAASGADREAASGADREAASGDASRARRETAASTPGEADARDRSGESTVDEEVAWVEGDGTWTARQSVPPSPAAGRRTDLRRVVGSTQALVISAALALFYPVIAFGAVFPAFPPVVNVVLIVCLVVIATYLLAIPEFGLAIFGGWAIVGGIALVVIGPTVPLLVGYGLSTWIPAGLSTLTMWVIRY